MPRSVRALVAAVVGALSGLAGCGSEGPALQPNIVLIVSDDHGYPDYGFMGSPVVRTPRLDQLAEEGVVFTHGYSTASVCRPALFTLLTGLLPIQLHFWERAFLAAEGGRPGDGSFVASIETLPRLLAERGYATFQAGKHWEGTYEDAGFSAGMVDADGHEGVARQWKVLVRDSIEPVNRFVDEHADGPFFVWFAPLLPHLPHDAPPRFRRLYPEVKGFAGSYYAAVSWLDEGIGRLVDHIQGLGIERRTLFVYVADNGWDAGSWDSVLGGAKGKMSLHELGFRTPVILRWLGGIAPAPHRDELVSTTDVFATLLDYAGARKPPHRTGHSLRPLLEGRHAWPRTELLGWVNRLRADGPTGFTRGGAFWRDRRWHYLQPAVGPARLFDLESDPLEVPWT